MRFVTTLTGVKKSALMLRLYNAGRLDAATLETHGVSLDGKLPNQSRKEKRPEVTLADLPCVHRGEKTEPTRCKACSSGGHAKVPTWLCGVYGTCTVHNVTPFPGERKPTACITCDDRQPDESKTPPH